MADLSFVLEAQAVATHVLNMLVIGGGYHVCVDAYIHVQAWQIHVIYHAYSVYVENAHIAQASVYTSLQYASAYTTSLGISAWEESQHPKSGHPQPVVSGNGKVHSIVQNVGTFVSAKTLLVNPSSQLPN